MTRMGKLMLVLVGLVLFALTTISFADPPPEVVTRSGYLTPEQLAQVRPAAPPSPPRAQAKAPAADERADAGDDLGDELDEPGAPAMEDRGGS